MLLNSTSDTGVQNHIKILSNSAESIDSAGRLNMERTLFEEFMDGIKDGKTYSIDLSHHNLSLNRKRIIHEGKWNDEKILIEKDDKPIETLLNLFREYQTSVPFSRSYKKRKHIYHAKDVDELTDEEIMTGKNRYDIQAELEARTLMYILSGMEYPGGKKWFFKHPDENNFIMLKKWWKGADARE